MSNVAKIDNFVNRFEKTDTIDNVNNTFVVIPFQASGMETYTNSGYKEGVRNPNDYETFKQIWTGNDACVIAWKGSVSATQNPETKEMEVSYQLGDYLLGELELNAKDIVVETDKSFTEYKSQESQITVSMRFNKNFEIDETYDFMFYKIPELYKITLFRIESVNKNYLYDKYLGCTITFKSVNQTYANSGRARQQNIMPNAPGQGYLEPIVYGVEWPEKLGKEEFEKLKPGTDYWKLENGKYISADYQKTMNRPVKKVVVKHFGAGIPATIAFIGRKVKEGQNFKKYGTPELIFPMNFIPPTTPNLLRGQGETQNFYFGEFVPQVLGIKDMMENLKGMASPINKWENQGVLKIDLTELRKTNPSNNYTAPFTHSIYGNTHTTSGGNIVREPWRFETKRKTLKGLASYGVDVGYNIGGNKIIHDHMWDNFWTQKIMKELPMSAYSSLGFGWFFKSAIGIGASVPGKLGLALGLTAAFVGISATLIQWATTPTFQSFRGLISADLVELNNQYGKDNSFSDKLSFNILQSQSKDNPSSIFFDGSTMVTGIEAELTDEFFSNRYGKKFNTANVGQTVDEEGSQLLSDGGPLLLSGDEELRSIGDIDYEGFIIDRIMIQSCFNGEISVEFKDAYDEVVWSGVYQSEGKWTNSLRSIWTIKNTSVFNRENLFFTDPLPYPRELPIPLGADIKTPKIEKDILNFKWRRIQPDADFDHKAISHLVDNGILQGFTNHKGLNVSCIVYNNQGQYNNNIQKTRIWDYTDIVSNFEKFKKYYNDFRFTYEVYLYAELAFRKVIGQDYNTAERRKVVNFGGFKTKDLVLNKWYDLDLPSSEDTHSDFWVWKVSSIYGGELAATVKPTINKVSVRIVEENNGLSLEMKCVNWRTYDYMGVFNNNFQEQFYWPVNQVWEFRDTFKIELIPRF